MKDVVTGYRGWNLVKKVDSRRERKAKYLYTKQGKGINVLACIGRSFVDYALTQGYSQLYIADFTLYLNYRDIYLDFRAQQVLTYIIHLFVCQLGSKPTDDDYLRASQITLDVRDVAEIFDMSVHGARKMLCRAVDALYSVDISWVEKSKKPDKNGVYQNRKFCRMRILSDYENDEVIKNSVSKPSVRHESVIVDNKLSVSLGRRFARYVAQSYSIYYPEAIFRIVPTRMSNAFPFAIKLLTMYKMNRKNSNYHLCSVDALLKSSTDIPMYGDILKTGEISRKIINPTIYGLECLQRLDILDYWFFVDKNGNKVSIDDVRSFGFAKFNQLAVIYDLVDYPNSKNKSKALDSGSIGCDLSFPLPAAALQNLDDEMVSAYDVPFFRNDSQSVPYQLNLF